MKTVGICAKCGTKLAIIGKHCQFCHEDILFEAWAYCDWKDKSTEFMLQYMQDTAKVDLDTVIEFIQSHSEQRTQWYKDNPDWFKKYT